MIVGSKPGNGETSQDGYVYQQYQSDVSNLAAVGANGARMQLDSVFMPLELCSAGKWQSTCAQDLQEVYKAKTPTQEAGLVGYANGVMPSTAEVFASGTRRSRCSGPAVADTTKPTPGRRPGCRQARLAGIAMQADAWNTGYSTLEGRVTPWRMCERRASGTTRVANGQSLVERRLYYDEARWGYSPSVQAWELVTRPASKLTSFWNGATVNVNGVPTYVAGVVSGCGLQRCDEPELKSSSHHGFMFCNVAEPSVRPRRPGREPLVRLQWRPTCLQPS